MPKTRLSDRELFERYDEMLDECYGETAIGGYKYATSHALRLVDPTAYHCGFNDWLDNELTDGCIEEENGEYYVA